LVVDQIFEWWYFKKYGTSFIEQFTITYLSPLLGGAEPSTSDADELVPATPELTVPGLCLSSSVSNSCLFLIIDLLPVLLYRVTTCLENLAMSGNLTAAWEMLDFTQSQGNVREKTCQGKVA